MPGSSPSRGIPGGITASARTPMPSGTRTPTPGLRPMRRRRARGGWAGPTGSGSARASVSRRPPWASPIRGTRRSAMRRAATSTNPEEGAMILENRVGLVVGVANARSIAAGCAAFAREGASLALTHLDERALPHVRPVAEAVGADELLPLDVTRPDQVDAVFDEITQRWGRLDFLLHSVAYCPGDDLHGRVVDCSAEGFGVAMDVSC